VARRAKAAQLAYQKRVELRKRAKTAHERLIARAQPEYIRLDLSWGKAAEAFLALVDKTPAALPMERVVHRLALGFAATQHEKNPEAEA